MNTESESMAMRHVAFIDQTEVIQLHSQISSVPTCLLKDEPNT
jgi:hypothetical protein